MRVDFQTLAIVSVLTTLTTECIKKLLEKSGFNYASNVVAAIVSVVISGAITIVRPMVVEGVQFSAALVYNGIVMAFFGVLSATLSFDKLKQSLMQLND